MQAVTIFCPSGPLGFRAELSWYLIMDCTGRLFHHERMRTAKLAFGIPTCSVERCCVQGHERPQSPTSYLVEHDFHNCQIIVTNSFSTISSSRVPRTARGCLCNGRALMSCNSLKIEHRSQQNKSGRSFHDLLRENRNFPTHSDFDLCDESRFGMAATNELCVICDNPGTLCNQCRSIRYCSRTCQMEDWNSHILVCRPYRDTFASSRRPAPECRRGVYFPENEPEPRFIWLDIVPHFNDDNGEFHYERPDLDDMMGEDLYVDQRYISWNMLLDRELENTIVLKMRREFLLDGSRPNQSINNHIVMRPGTQIWKGPFVAFRLQGHAPDPTHCGDMDTTDFKMVLDHLSVFGDDDIESYKQRRLQKSGKAPAKE